MSARNCLATRGNIGNRQKALYPLLALKSDCGKKRDERKRTPNKKSPSQLLNRDGDFLRLYNRKRF